MYKDKEGLYPEDYVGLRKCHLRALHSVREEAAREGLTAKIKHNATNEVRAVAKKYEEHGRVFHIREEHWVALRKVPGSSEGIYVDDMVRMEVSNYKGALAVLEVLESMKENVYDAVFGTGGTKRTKVASRGEKEITNAFLSFCCVTTAHAHDMHLSSVAQLLGDSLQVKQQGSQRLTRLKTWAVN